MLAPIVLFVYNRPWHTEQTLEALSLNKEAAESILYIYADGPKENARLEDLDKINKTRNVLRLKQWCKEVIIIEADKNKGLADSIIEGVTTVVNQFGKVIVLEDDIVTSKGFLRYMNGALDLYEAEEKVMHISAYMFPVKKQLPATFFYRQTSCWGWATWSSRWKYFEKSPQKLLTELENDRKLRYADIDGTNQFVEQLRANVEGRLKTWAVLWHFSVFIKNGLSLHPGKSLVKNIGMDNSGANCETTNIYEVALADSVPVNKIEIRDYRGVYTPLKKFYNQSKKVSAFKYAKNKLNVSLPSKFKEKIKIVFDKKFREDKIENNRLQKLPRFLEAETTFLGKRIKIVDSASFLFIRMEIFDQQIYRFNTNNTNPYIIDCGANIGLSVIYFKQLFPDAEIVAFEPDEKVFNALQYNVKSFGFSNVEVIKKACWNQETTLQFYSEGADGGRAAKDTDTENIIKVETIRLRNFLNKKVDFLKIDIEGAEIEVLEDIKDLLVMVDNLFVEYHSFATEDQQLDKLLLILKNAGFRYAIQQHGVTSKSPFVKIEQQSGMDILLNISAYRTLTK